MSLLRNLANRIHGIAASKGFWGPPEPMDKYQAKLMLVVTEVAEVTEALRKNQGPRKVTEEVCDVKIRLLDLFDVLVEEGLADPDIDGIFEEKVSKNEKRPALHGHTWG